VAVASGSRLGPYEIPSAIGARRIGEVYKARDTRRDRVAMFVQRFPGRQTCRGLGDWVF
jgi:hypothetical protein